MTRDELLHLIAQGEGQQIDFKEEAIKPGRLAETLVAFANAEGGIILIGVDDLGHIQGVSDPKRATDNVVEAVSRCSPPLGIGLPQAKDYGLIEKFGNSIGRITRSDYSRTYGVGSTEAYRELSEMLAKGLIVRQGKGRNTYYVPPPDNWERLGNDCVNDSSATRRSGLVS